ncbi:MAG: hypothetical protein ACKV19_07460 [Verrucomicrobiales bacterium]
MAEPPQSIADLQQQLAASRAEVRRATADLSTALDVPARVSRTLKQKVTAHPIAWALLAVAGGFVVVRTLPLAVGLLRAAGSRRLISTLMTTVGPIALRAGLNALAARESHDHHSTASADREPSHNR